MVRQLAAVVSVLGLALAACGNSGDDDEPAAADTTTTENTGDTGATTAPAGGGEGDRNTFVPIEGVPGVTDDSIGFAVIGTEANNPLGTCMLDCYRAGIEAYFAFRNSEGGIYGRELTVSRAIDDKLSENQAAALEVISSDDSFGVFNATLLAAGWADLDEAGIPTYVWGIRGPEAAGKEGIFPHLAPICITCSQRGVAYAAQVAGATKVASLGYGVDESSKLCAQSNENSIEMYAGETGAEFVYLADELAFGLPNGIGPEVTAMRDAGVDFIAACLDLNGMLTLAQELDRQGMDDVVLYHPNSYDQGFIAENAELFEGDLVSPQFLPFEAAPEGTLMEEFLHWMDETGAEVSELAMIGWINADLAFQGLLAAGPQFDRASVIAATNQMTAYDAGGLINPIDWTRQHVPATEGDPSHDYVNECVAMVRVVDGAFETVAPPETPWLCWSNETLEWSEPEPTSFAS
jgi:hypothetical protein